MHSRTVLERPSTASAQNIRTAVLDARPNSADSAARTILTNLETSLYTVAPQLPQIKAELSVRDVSNEKLVSGSQFRSILKYPKACLHCRELNFALKQQKTIIRGLRLQLSRYEDQLRAYISVQKKVDELLVQNDTNTELALAQAQLQAKEKHCLELEEQLATLRKALFEEKSKSEEDRVNLTSQISQWRKKAIADHAKLEDETAMLESLTKRTTDTIQKLEKELEMATEKNGLSVHKIQELELTIQQLRQDIASNPLAAQVSSQNLYTYISSTSTELSYY